MLELSQIIPLLDSHFWFFPLNLNKDLHLFPNEMRIHTLKGINKNNLIHLSEINAHFFTCRFSAPYF